MDEHQPTEEEKAKAREETARSVGLPAGTTQDQLNRFFVTRGARRLGMPNPEKVTSEELMRHRQSLGREGIAQKYGLPRNASWDEINRQEGRMK